ncbi:unnamed protein product [Brassica rapa]|uniref:Uncharacterized protein n=1 Tax=Brassica campestris TaxID=3711 RepID=A0A8D9GYF6_BRACM|nr:unnamed protein product [Brassica rapa]
MNFSVLSHVFLTNLSLLQVFNQMIYLIFHSFSLFLTHFNVFGYAGFSDLDLKKFSRRLPGSRLDFQEVVWTSWKSSGLRGSFLTKSSFHNRSQPCLCRGMIYNSFVCGLFCELHAYSLSCEFFVKSVIMFHKM